MPKNCKLVQMFASKVELTNRLINFTLVIDFFLEKLELFLKLLETFRRIDLHGSS